MALSAATMVTIPPGSSLSEDLSSSGLSGKIDSSLSNLESLQYLDLSNNSLTGEVPDFLSQLPLLKTLNLSGNEFTGSVPSLLIQRSKNGSLSLRCYQNNQLKVNPFALQAQLLTKVHHRNLAPLIGYCNEGRYKGIVYEYMANGNLREHLSGAGKDTPVLSWEQRLQIAVDAAQAFEYLHEGCKPPIIHRDVKTSNILLDGKLQAKVADFGLSRFMPSESRTIVSTQVAGTPGYLDPEYYISNNLNEKSDVYAFGIVLLELVTGHPAIIPGHENTHLVDWLSPRLAGGEIRSIVDSRLNGDFNPNSAWKLVETAMACVPRSSIQRPTMSQVVADLKECLQMEMHRNKSASQSRTYQDTASSTRRQEERNGVTSIVQSNQAAGNPNFDGNPPVAPTPLGTNMTGICFKDQLWLNSYPNSNEHMFGTPDQQLMTVRSFPEGTKNCYTLQPQQGKDNKYLIRASFMYGNYDSKNQLPEFKLYLGVNEWDAVKFNHSYDIVRKEIIHVPRTGHIDVCLVNTGSGSPFISALELRQLNNSIYSTQSGSLILFKRLDIGSTRQTVRYKDDAFDRIWEPFSRPYWKSVSASYSSDTLSDNHFKPPSKVMATAVTPADERYPLEFHWNLDNSTRQFYVYTHFAEVEELQSNQLRELYVSLNGWFWSPEPIVPGRLVPHTGFSAHSISASSELSLSIFKTHRSTLPPILNALEIYEIKQLFQSSTVQSNVDAIKKIKAVYKVKKNWQGDPCLPIEFSWNGLSCSDNSPLSPSTVSFRNLSWSKLTGKIDSSFSNLTSLKSLDLSYNSLTGEVPNFLSKLPSLKTLNLSGNNLTGSVPLALIEKSRNGSLSLRLDGNLNLCKKNSCEEEEDKEKSSNNVIVPLVASIISVLVLLLGEVAALWIFKRRQQHGILLCGMALDSMNPRLSYSEVNRITGNFKKLLDQGESAEVYLGHLSDGTEVAVKMLTPSSVLVFKQFKTEASFSTQAKRKVNFNVVGCFQHSCPKAMHFDKTAESFNLSCMHAGKKETVLSWEQRLRIAINTAQALEYLHDGCNPPIIHRDVKTENILLNEKIQAKVAAFGWSRSMPSEGGSYVSTAIVGTPGYIDPEYDKTSVPSKKTDIYSFGIVLLELISGRPAIIKITKESPFSSIDRPTMNIVVKPNEDDKTFEPKNQHLTYFEVERITDNFQKELGRGASSIVYHGHLSNGTEVAVKKLSPSSILGSKQFKTEAQLLTRVHHKNLVSLFGYCDEGSNMVLIYEYMAKGNVKAYLSGKTEAVLSWEQRLQIAIDAAQALEYLHNGCNPPIIHRDIKTENILLNEKLQAKVADFGWSKSMPAEGGSYVLTAIVGTPGYLDPEYHRSSVPNEKTDVYSFGIVLLELISGRPAIIKITKENLCNITNWVHHIIAKGDIRMIVDPRLQGEFETNSARRTIETAMSCVSFSSTERPTMSDIVVELRECLKIAMAHERTNNLEEDHDSAGIEAAMTAEER
ncbi:unnamed protein product, partial [Vitis vinifera]